MIEMMGFDNWQSVINYCKETKEVYYHPPLNYSAVKVKVDRVSLKRVRIIPFDKEADPFWADSGHLDRFRKL